MHVLEMPAAWLCRWVLRRRGANVGRRDELHGCLLQLMDPTTLIPLECCGAWLTEPCCMDEWPGGWGVGRE